MQIKEDPFENDFNLRDIASLQTDNDNTGARTPNSVQSAPKKDDKTPKTGEKGVTMTGEPADQVVINPDHDPNKINEAAGSTAVMAFGRMNPPTVGHEKLIHKVESVAKEHNGHAHIVASHSEGTSKDPLPQKAKIGYIKKVAAKGTKVMGSSKEAPTIMHAASALHKAGHQHLVVVAGEDRVQEYHKLLHKYNGVEGKHGHYNFKSIKVVSAGHRDPDAEGTEGMSGTKMRSLAREGKHKEFKSGLPKSLHGHAEEIANHIRSVKEEVELEETAGLQTRLHRAAIMRRNAKKLAQARKIARQRLAKAKNLRRRALKKARGIMRQRLAGERGKEYGKLSTSDKMAIDRMADKRKKQITRMATRIGPKIKRNDIQRLASIAAGKKVKNATIPLVSSFEPKAAKALMEKATKAGIDFATIAEVFQRGVNQYQQNEKVTQQQFAFARVNSFLSNGKAAEMDKDLIEQRKKVQYTARNTDQMDVENLPQVLPAKQLKDILTSIKKDETENDGKAARRKADFVRRSSGEQYRKVVEAAKQKLADKLNENSMFKRAAMKITTKQSPQLGNLKKDLVKALQTKKYNDVADIVLYLVRQQLSGNKRVAQENVCVPEDDYIYEEMSWEQWLEIEGSINENFLVGIEEEEGRKLNKPFRTPGGPKKFAVYVKNDKGNVVKLGFGDPNLEIKRDDPDRRKAYRARHGCDNPGPKWKANYWSCNWSWSASKKVGA